MREYRRLNSGNHSDSSLGSISVFAIVIVLALVIVSVAVVSVVINNGPESHSVVYDVNGGSGSVPSITVEEGQAFTISPYSGTKYGYVFAGWTYNGGQYTPGTVMTMGSINVTFVAVWNPAPVHNVYFDVNGGTGFVASQKAFEGGEYVLPYYSGGQTGQRFIGWSQNDAIYSPGSTLVMGTSDTLFTALWIPKTANTHEFYIELIGSDGICYDKYRVYYDCEPNAYDLADAANKAFSEVPGLSGLSISYSLWLDYNGSGNCSVYHSEKSQWVENNIILDDYLNYSLIGAAIGFGFISESVYSSLPSQEQAHWGYTGWGGDFAYIRLLDSSAATR